MFEPANEQGVIVLFTQQAKDLGIEIIEIQTRFPDAIIKVRDKVYQVEFEYKSSSFITHGHDVRGCDVIICWENDLLDFILPIWELSASAWRSNLDVNVPDSVEKNAFYWESRARIAENELGKAMAAVNQLESKDGEDGGNRVYLPEIRGKTARRAFSLDDEKDKDVLGYLDNLAMTGDASRVIREAIRLFMSEESITSSDIMRELKDLKVKLHMLDIHRDSS